MQRLNILFVNFQVLICFALKISFSSPFAFFHRIRALILILHIACEIWQRSRKNFIKHGYFLWVRMQFFVHINTTSEVLVRCLGSAHPFDIFFILPSFFFSFFSTALVLCQNYFCSLLCCFGPTFAVAVAVAKELLTQFYLQLHFALTHYAHKHAQVHKHTHTHHTDTHIDTHACLEYICDSLAARLQLSSLELRSTVQVKRKCIFEVYIFSLPFSLTHSILLCRSLSACSSGFRYHVTATVNTLNLQRCVCVCTACLCVT